MSVALDTVVLCLDVTPRATSQRELLAMRDKIREIEGYLAAQRAAGVPVLHLRPGGDAGVVTMTRLRPEPGETVFVWRDGTRPFDHGAFRDHLDALNPTLLRVICGARDEGSADFCMSLANVGYEIDWLRTDLAPDFDRLNNKHLASVTEVRHPRVAHRAMRKALAVDGRKRAND